MFSAEFEYYRASSLADALRLLEEHPGAKLIAGGQSLIPLLKLRLSRPEAVIDIGRIAELKGITVGSSTARVGALTTHAEVASSTVLREACPILGEAAEQIGDPQVRNRGTIGGNVAHADPASDMPAVLSALGARFNVASPSGERGLEAKDFFQGVFSTALAENEVLTSIEVPVQREGQGMAYAKFAHPASRVAVVGVAAVIGLRDGRCMGASVALGGLVPMPARASSVERVMIGATLTEDTVKEASEGLGDDLGDEVLGDFYASSDFRVAMAKVYVRRAIATSVERAG